MLTSECVTFALPKRPFPKALGVDPEDGPPFGIYTSSSDSCFVFIATVGHFNLGLLFII